ncbi:MAG: hypothetical protein EB084_15780 [Proteobacteria bacterium]|nr:hypothetical protein [Pseudomonadota bacterium]
MGDPLANRKRGLTGQAEVPDVRMELTRLYVLPFLLCLAAATLLGVETRTLQVERERGAAHWGRFLRRAFGALLIALVGFMLHFGSAPPERGAPQELIYRQLYYWLAVLGMVLTASALAVYDVFASLRTIRQQVDHLEQAEMQQLRDTLKKQD